MISGVSSPVLALVFPFAVSMTASANVIYDFSGGLDIHRQGHPIVQQALTPNQNLAGPPVDVLELQRDHLPSTQAETGEQKKDRVVPAA
jgi:hypothetical protein